MSSERTFAGWLRTSLGSIAVGIGFLALFNKLQPTWVPRTIATWFLVIGVAMCWLAVVRAAAVLRRLSPHVVSGARKRSLELIALAVSVGATGLAAASWLLPAG